MKVLKCIAIVLTFLVFNIGLTQTRVAILDFENTSGITKYDGFGKALSNMLITDLKNNIHPRKVAFLERSQLNKILEEQGLQKSKDFDNSTAVSFGKLAGVKYVLLGSVYVLDGKCNISARLVDVETTEIIYAKESNGKISEWLSLKTVLAEELAKELNNPIKVDDAFTSEINEGTIVQYSKVINKMDEGDVEGANNMAEMLTDLQPDFKYFKEIQLEIEAIKERLSNLENEVEVSVNDPIGSAMNFYDNGNHDQAIKYLKIGRNRLAKNDIGGLIYYFYRFQEVYDKIDTKKSIAYCDSILNIYPYLENVIMLKTLLLNKLEQYGEALNLIEPLIRNYEKHTNIDLFDQYLLAYLKKDNIEKTGSNGIALDATFVYGYQIQVNGHNLYGHGLDFHQGIHYSDHVSLFVEILENLYSPEKVIEILESITFHKPGYFELSEVNTKKIKPYYVPSNLYKSFHTDTLDIDIYIALTGEMYNGEYHELRNGGLWTQKSSMDCPCDILATKEGLDLNKSKEVSDSILSKHHYEMSFSIGWQYLVNGQPKKAQSKYLEIMDYFSRYDEGEWGYRKLSSNNQYIISKINLAHAYLLDNKKEKALELYYSFNFNFKLSQFNDLTIKEVLLDDWALFLEKDLLSEKAFKRIMDDLNAEIKKKKK